MVINQEVGAPVLIGRACQMDIGKHRFTVTSKRGRRVEVELTPTEWTITEVLLTNNGEAVPYEGLQGRVWGVGGSGEVRGDPALLHFHISRLRKKLRVARERYNPIKSIPKFGYRWKK